MNYHGKAGPHRIDDVVGEIAPEITHGETQESEGLDLSDRNRKEGLFFLAYAGIAYATILLASPAIELWQGYVRFIGENKIYSLIIP